MLQNSSAGQRLSTSAPPRLGASPHGAATPAPIITSRRVQPHLPWALLAALGVAIISTSGCVVGPNYHRPAVDAPPAWKEQPPEGWKNAAPRDDISKGNWWEVFGDTQLNDLETQAVAANQNLKVAAERVIEARATALATR